MNAEVEILQNKVDHLLSQRTGKNQSVLERIERDNSLLTDYIVNLGSNMDVTFNANGKMYMNFDDSQFQIHPHALMQLGDKFNIPRKYVGYLNESDWGRQLLNNVLTEHSANIDRNRLLVRTVGDETRAVLSDKYRRLNSNEIYESFIKGCHNMGAVIYDAYYSETKSYIHTIIPRVYTIETPNNGNVYSVFGARIGNSDYGDGALGVRAFQMNVACLNGMVTDTLLKQIHLGKRLPDDINFSERTYTLDTRAMASAIDDIMVSVLSPNRIMETVQNVYKASHEMIDIDKEIIKLPRMGFTKEETSLVQTKLLQSDPSQGVVGAPTRWKLSQAITAVSNDIGERRKQELDELAGKIASI